MVAPGDSKHSALSFLIGLRLAYQTGRTATCGCAGLGIYPLFGTSLGLPATSNSTSRSSSADATTVVPRALRRPGFVKYLQDRRTHSMAIREDVVVSAVGGSPNPLAPGHADRVARRRDVGRLLITPWPPANVSVVLQDPNVASSPIQNRIAFLQAKNLTQEEIDVALARAADGGGAVPPNPTGLAGPAPPPFAPGAYRSGDAAYGWRHPPPELPRRDWRDWFIMATVMGGVGYGLYSMTMVRPAPRAERNAMLTPRSAISTRSSRRRHPGGWSRTRSSSTSSSRESSSWLSNLRIT